MRPTTYVRDTSATLVFQVPDTGTRYKAITTISNRGKNFYRYLVQQYAVLVV